MGTVKYSGPVASFHCPTEATIRSLKVHFSPKQLGEGTPSLENVRPIEGWDGVQVEQRGKNLFDKNNIGYYNWNIGTFNNSTNYRYWRIPVKEGDIIYYKGTGSGVGCFFDKDGNCFGKILSSPVTVPANAIEATNNFTSQGAEGGIVQVNKPISAYEPYHGSTTNYEFGVLGKNKLSDNIDDYNFLTPSHSAYSYTLNNGEFSATVPSGVRDYLIILGQEQYPPGTYTLSFDYINGGGNTAWQPVLAQYTSSWYSSKVAFYANQSEGHCERTFTSDVPFSINLCLNSFGNTTQEGLNKIYNLQLELGSTATTYEPYDPNHTMYGGWVDLVSGEVCEEWKSIALESLDWNGSGNRVRASNSINLEIPSYTVAPDFIAEKYYAAPYSTNLTNYPSAMALGSGGFISYYDGETLPSGKMIYKLPESNYYNLPLHSSELKTFLAQNNIWSNADYVEVEYDLHETQTILARKQFIIANQPHVVKPAAAPLQNFVTDMAAPLKECKIHFSPVQEGEGDPSPENVRAISGWNSIQIGLPSEYQRVEWIGNTSASYINSGIECTSDLAVRFKFSCSTNQNFAFCGGIYLPDEPTYFRHHCSPYNNNFYWIQYNDSTIPSIRHSFSVNTVYEVFVDPVNGIASINGDNQTFDPLPSGLTTGKKYGILGRVASNAARQQRNARVYYFRFYRNGKQIGDFIPCYRKSDGEIGMYDTVTQTFFTNQGSGEFVCGPDVEEQSILVDWTDEAGTVYGGYVDVKNGEIWETYHEININELGTYRKLSINNNNNTTISWFLDNHFHAPTAIGYVPYSEDGYCSCFPFLVNNYNFNPKCQVNDNVMSLTIEGELTAEEVDTWIKKYAPIQIVYHLRTPRLVGTLTLAQFKTLRGTNNIWASNGGDNIEIAYWKH